MTTYSQRLSLLEFLYRKPGVAFPLIAENRAIQECMVRDVFEDLQRSKVRLGEQVAALQARNKDLEAYAHMVAHDLKDPLTVLIVTSDLINKIPDLTGQELKDDLEQIRFIAYEMNSIINNLLLFAEENAVEAPVQPVDMARVVANVRQRLSYMIRENKAQIDLPGGWPNAIGYEPWIEEVWANFLSNAIKHGGRPPCIELGACAQQDGMVRFWTRDNGPGFPPEATAHLFLQFSQVDRRDSSGHGLGLSIASRIVKKLGGEVGIETDSGKGSLFFFTLPPDPLANDQNHDPLHSYASSEAFFPN
jgi:two-component system, sensor histidine kinase and response regulator